MQSDVDRLVRAAEQLTGTWPLGPPPPVSEVDLVTRHGSPVVPLLVALLLDDPDLADRKRWQVAQRATLALSRIYSESQHCGRTYCDADVPGRIARVKEGWLRLIASDAELRALPSKELLNRFRQESVFWRQAFWSIQARNLAKMSAAGVEIVLGTDGSTPYAAHVEMLDMVTAGLTPMQVIVAATRNGARFLKLADAGTIGANKSADFVVLDANPLDDISNTRRIASVYLRGAVVDRSSYR